MRLPTLSCANPLRHYTSPTDLQPTVREADPHGRSSQLARPGEDNPAPPCGARQAIEPAFTKGHKFLVVRDAQAWLTSELSCEERGAERFAESIVFGLYDQLRRPTLIDVSSAELHATFQSITGHPALGPIEPVRAMLAFGTATAHGTTLSSWFRGKTRLMR